jgi:putative ABC transport system permease protein
MQDLRFALRQLAKSRGFTVTALLLLAIGIGATTVTFTLVNGVLLRPFPAVEPARLVALDEYNDSPDFGQAMAVSYVNFRDWRRDNRTLDHLSVYEEMGYTLSDSSTAEHVDAATASVGFFEAFGAAPELGRTFRDEEESLTGSRVVVLSHEMWTRRFHGDPAIIGQSVRLNGVPHTVVGVMAAGFRYPDNATLWTPLRAETNDDNRGAHSFDAVGRLRPGATLEQAQLDLTAIAANLAKAHPSTNLHAGVRVMSFVGRLTGDYSRMVLTLFTAVGGLLLITCVNLAGLLVARGKTREREIAVRAALGATRGRIVGQLLVENLLLGLIGGGLGLVFAFWGMDLLRRVVADNVPYWMQFNIDGSVLGFALAISVVASVAFGLVPTLQLSRLTLNDSLKDGGRLGSPARSGTMRILVGVQLAMALVLLVAAGLVVKSFLQLRSVRPGFETAGLLTFELELPPAAYQSDRSKIDADERLTAALQAVPGVESAALISNLPLGGSNWGRGFTIEGQPTPEPGRYPIALNRVVSAEYFRTMRIPIVRGRGFTGSDNLTAPRVAVVDETFVKQYLPHENPIGHRIHYGRTVDADHPWLEIVGVAGDVRHYDLQNSVVRPGLYVPSAQNTTEYSTFFAVRAAPGIYVEGLTASVRHAVGEVDRNLAIADVQTMAARVDQAIWSDRMVGEILAGFAVLALLLSALGVYGVTAFATSQRTREIGVRMALGAQPADVLRLMLSGGLKLTTISLGLGAAAALALTHLLASQLYNVDPRDPTIFAGVAVLLGAVTVLACLIPARRATKVDPVVALRAE